MNEDEKDGEPDIAFRSQIFQLIVLLYKCPRTKFYVCLANDLRLRVFYRLMAEKFI